jgi:hypothetical protein
MFTNSPLKTFLFLVLYFSLSTPIVLFAQKWNLAKESNGIKVYTRKIDGWGLKEYKAEMTVKAPFQTIIATIKDAKDRTQWSHNSIEAREIERPSKNTIYIYNKVDAPWPVSDRDNIVKYVFEYPSPNSAKIYMSAIKTHPKAPLYQGIVRVEKLKGFWAINDNKNGTISVVQQCVADPGGNIPDWLSNSAIVDNPFQTMTKFRTYVESKK